MCQVMESEHLAPHGVPGGFKPMARSRRNSTEEPVQAAVTQPNPMDDPGKKEIFRNSETPPPTLQSRHTKYSVS